MAEVNFDTSVWNPRAPRLDPNTGQYTTPPPAQISGDQDALTRFRQAADSARYYENQTDTEVFSDPRFQHFAATGEYRPSSQAFPDEEKAGANFGQGRAAQPTVPNQFDDPYTNLLENISKSQMGEIRNNPGLNQLTSFLNSQFKDLSTSPGFSPAELSVLNTQAFEPIEQMRKAAQQRSTQRIASRGFLPSSGLAELDARNIDQEFDKLRTGAARDLAVNAIDRRDSDLNRAGQIAAQLGLQIPQGQRAEELNLANLLYGLPRNALMDALAVVNASGGTNGLYTGANLLAQQQQYEQQQNALRWAQIAQFLENIL